MLHISCESSKMMLHISCESSHDDSQVMWSIISLGSRKLETACWYFKAALYGQWKVVNIQEQRSAYGHRETIIKGLLSELLPLGLICHRYMRKTSHVSILYRIWKWNSTAKLHMISLPLSLIRAGLDLLLVSIPTLTQETKEDLFYFTTEQNISLLT